MISSTSAIDAAIAAAEREFRLAEEKVEAKKKVLSAGKAVVALNAMKALAMVKTENKTEDGPAIAPAEWTSCPDTGGMIRATATSTNAEDGTQPAYPVTPPSDDVTAEEPPAPKVVKTEEPPAEITVARLKPEDVPDGWMVCSDTGGLARINAPVAVEEKAEATEDASAPEWTACPETGGLIRVSTPVTAEDAENEPEDVPAPGPAEWVPCPETGGIIRASASAKEVKTEEPPAYTPEEVPPEAKEEPPAAEPKEGKAKAKSKSKSKSKAKAKAEVPAAAEKVTSDEPPAPKVVKTEEPPAGPEITVAPLKPEDVPDGWMVCPDTGGLVRINAPVAVEEKEEATENASAMAAPEWAACPETGGLIRISTSVKEAKPEEPPPATAEEPPAPKEVEVKTEELPAAPEITVAPLKPEDVPDGWMVCPDTGGLVRINAPVTAEEGDKADDPPEANWAVCPDTGGKIRVTATVKV